MTDLAITDRLHTGVSSWTGMARPKSRKPDPAISAVIGIARLAHLTGTSQRALRHYEAEGLLSPLRVDAGKRLFTSRHREIAALIVALRRFDVPIAEIRPLCDGTISDADRPNAIRHLLQCREVDMARQLSAIRLAISETL